MIISKAQFATIWGKWQDSVRYICKLQKREYCHIKEVQHNNLHVHGIELSNMPMDTMSMRKSWQRLMLKYAERKIHLEDIEISIARTSISAAKYTFKDIVNPDGLQLPWRETFPRLVMLSRKVFDATSPVYSRQSSI
jgi:hypothetical protein